MLDLLGKRSAILEADGNLLVMGGPGSGKTTIALLKADCIIHSDLLDTGQKILFLSFARATISRVEQQVKTMLKSSGTSSLEVTTYHSFIWTVLRSHGYLLVPHKMQLLLPHDASTRLSVFAPEEQASEIERLFQEEGVLHFDLFAKSCTDLLMRSAALSEIIATAYPIIILDEFQDTNEHEWLLISHLGKRSTLIALADPDQRIYDFRGASPARIQQFAEAFCPSKFDFGTENNRSSGTDIVEFGNDLLAGRNKGKSYKNVHIKKYRSRARNSHLIYLKKYVLKRISENSNNVDWSMAILTPSNQMMTTISHYLSDQHKVNGEDIIPAVPHEVAIDSSGPSIAAITIAELLELASRQECTLKDFVLALCKHILGRGGGKKVSKANQELVQSLTEYVTRRDYSKEIRGKNRQLIIKECEEIVAQCSNTNFTGDVASDWMLIRDALTSATTDCIERLLKDAMHIRLLHKGSLLSSSLARIWRTSGNYFGAAEAVKNAITQEHFALSLKTWSGVNVMTIHKAKGKEFDEVIIYEGLHNGRIVVDDDLDKARLSLRVAVTRAKNSAVIVTPEDNPCPLL